MVIRRREILAAMGSAIAVPAHAQTANNSASTPSQQPPLDQRIIELAKANRYALSFDGTKFSGPAWDFLVREGSSAQAFLLGEEHGIAENAKLAAELFEALQPAGYAKVAVEISPPMATEINRILNTGGIDAIRSFFANPSTNVAFFGMREEVEWLAAAQRTVKVAAPFLWGLDYEVFADRHLIALLKAKSKPPAAQAALAALETASVESWARYDETHGPEHMFSFVGEPALVQAIRTAWPGADADTDWILETLEETFAINRHWAMKEGWQSNRRRAQLNRSNLSRYWAAEKTPKSKVFYKFGAGHMVRGLSHTFVHDIGTKVAETTESTGGQSFHLMVLPGPGSNVASFDAATWTYKPQAAGTNDNLGTSLFTTNGISDGFTLFDFRPLRSLVSGRRAKSLDADLVRNIHGFDALLVMTGSTPSANL